MCVCVYVAFTKIHREGVQFTLPILKGISCPTFLRIEFKLKKRLNFISLRNWAAAVDKGMTQLLCLQTNK